MFMGYIIFSFFFHFFHLFFILKRMRLERFRESGFFLMAICCYATLRRYASMEVRMDLLVGVMLMTAYRLPDLT